MRCQILRLKCTKSAPEPAVGAYSTPRDSLAAIKVPSSNGREGEGKGKEVREEVSPQIF